MANQKRDCLCPCGCGATIIYAGSAEPPDVPICWDCVVNKCGIKN